MKYLLLIGVDPSAMPTDPAAQAAMSVEYTVVTEKMQAAGELLGGEQLGTPDTATSVRVRDGRTLLTDGPFAETTEQIGGFYLVDVPDLDRALEIAATIPAAFNGGVVEVRPVVTMR
jgi:hypothetical protein